MKKKVTPEDIENYIRGNWNKIKEKIVPLGKDFSDVIRERQLICKTCVDFSLNDPNKNAKDSEPHCKACGCSFPEYTYAEKKICPKGNWGPYIKETKED